MGGGGSAPKTKKYTLPLYEPAQTDIFNQVANYLGQGNETLNLDALVDQYQGQLSADPTEGYQRNLDLASSLGQTATDVLAGNKQLSDTIGKQLSDIINAGPADTEAFYQTNVADPALRTYNQQVLPTIEKTFAGGRYGSDFQRQIQLSNQELQRNLVQSRESLLKDQLDQMYNRRLAAIGLEQQLPNVQTAGINNATNLLDRGLVAGEAETKLKQEGLDRQYSEFLNQLQQKKVGLETVFNFLSQRTKENVVTNSGGSSAGASPVWTAVGAAGAGVAAGLGAAAAGAGTGAAAGAGIAAAVAAL